MSPQQLYMGVPPLFTKIKILLPKSKSLFGTKIKEAVYLPSVKSPNAEVFCKKQVLSAAELRAQRNHCPTRTNSFSSLQPSSILKGGECHIGLHCVKKDSIYQHSIRG